MNHMFRTQLVKLVSSSGPMRLSLSNSAILSIHLQMLSDHLKWGIPSQMGDTTQHCKEELSILCSGDTE